MKRYTFVIIILISSLSLCAKDIKKIHDSLAQVVSNPNLPIEKKVDAAKNLLQTTWADDPNFLHYIKLCDSLSLAIEDQELKAFVNLNYGQYFNYIDQYDSAREYLSKAYEYYSKTGNHRFLAASCGEMGNSYCFNGDYRQCLDWFLRALDHIYKVGDTPWIAVNLNNIGNVYYYLSDTDRAMEYYQQAYKLFKIKNHSQGIALTTNNIGVIFKDRGLLDSAYKYFSMAIDHAKKSNYLEQLSETYDHLSTVALELGKIDSALSYIEESIKIAKLTGNKSQLADAFSIKAEILGHKQRYSIAQQYLDSAYNLAKTIGAQEIIKNIFYTKFVLDTLQHNYQSAIQNYIHYTKLKDSLTGEKIRKDIANLESVYQLKLAEKENRLLKAKQEKQQLIIERHRIIFASIAFVVLLIIVFFVILWKQYKRIRKYNLELESKNKEITQKNIILNQQKEEIHSQKEEIERQHKELVYSQKKIQESINYAHRIQSTLLPSTNIFRLYFREAFVLFIPQEVVSGDFYWAEDTGNKFYFAVGDCTGHGVPGAFISMMVLTMLKEIVKTHPDYTAAQILSQMRDNIKKTFAASDNSRLFTDGADVALAIMETRTFEVNFAGAYRPFYLFRQGNLTVIKGDRQPLGSYLKEKPFTDHFIKLEKGDVIYLFTDGYHDQIAATSLRKFMINHFKKILEQIQHLDMNKQKQVLEDTFYQWKQDAPQIDDVTVLGLKL